MKNLLVLSLFLALFISCKKEETRQVQQYTIEQFYANTRFGGGMFSGDETKLLINSDESGIFNVYEINLADGQRRPLTTSAKESCFAVDYVPGHPGFIYSSDQGGNEITHLYLQEDDGKTTDLTPGENEKAGFMKWSEDKQFLFYTSNKRDSKFFDVYKMKIGEWSPTLIYENKEGLDLADISFDETWAAITKPIKTSENELYLLNLKTGEKKLISTPEEKGSYDISGFSRDNRLVYFTTDAGKEFGYLAQMDIATGEKKVLYETKWDVMFSVLSEHEKYRVIAINEDAKNTIMVQETATGKKIEFPDIPDGDITNVVISNSEKQIRLTVGTSTAPNNLYVYNLETGELKKLTESLNKAINPDDLVAAEVVRFKSFDDLEIPAVYSKPIQATKENKVPALVWVHGGPGGQSRIGYHALIQYLVNHGYAILAVNNRGSSGYGKTFYKMDDRNHGDKDLKDCIAGKQWLASQDYIDGEKIGIIGGSYGGYMTMAAMTYTPDEFAVGVNIFGVTNWLRTLKSIPPFWESFRQALYEEIGDPNTADSVRLYNISPVFHASKIKHPVMVLQGANDPRVLQIESDEIVEGIKKNNVPVEYVVFPDEGHGFIKKENEIKGYSQILKFLDQYLKAPMKG